ncbi:MAG TPA: thiamine pyrophosphate-binding protein, partial [Candidatus Methylomirabilis sp.]|nr:thiamine pyrophosphate-binding protein [Candidatus Methylomirabilis sp.]
MRVGEYLFQRLKALGVRHSFGIPGDFVLPLYQALERTSIRPIVVTHEPAAGFAADAYARLKGLGVALVTYGAGALNLVNAIAQAYAERSPVLVVSGAPEIRDRRLETLVHHKVRSFESQLIVYQEITCATAALNDPRTALEEI